MRETDGNINLIKKPGNFSVSPSPLGTNLVLLTGLDFVGVVPRGFGDRAWAHRHV